MLDGFEVLGTHPKPRTSEWMFDYVSYGYSRNLKPGESFAFDLHLRATELGLWGGDIDAVTPSMNLITHYTEIDVVDAPAGEGE